MHSSECNWLITWHVSCSLFFVGPPSVSCYALIKSVWKVLFLYLMTNDICVEWEPKVSSKCFLYESIFHGLIISLVEKKWYFCSWKFYFLNKAGFGHSFVCWGAICISSSVNSRFINFLHFSMELLAYFVFSYYYKILMFQSSLCCKYFPS